MKRFILISVIITSLSAGLYAESVMTGLFNTADGVVSDLTGILHGEGDLLLGGVSFNSTQVQLGDLLADLTANRLIGKNGFEPNIVKNYSMPQYPPAQASWVLSGTLYEAGAGYLLILQIVDNSDGSQLKGWEFVLGSDGIDSLLQPSALSADTGAWDRMEPNDTSREAAEIELPFHEEGLTLGDEDEDWFSFDVPRSGSGTVQMMEAATGGSMDTYMELYAPDDQSWSVAENDDFDGANAAIQMPLNTPGTWYLKVRAFSMDEGGEYSLDITLTEKEPEEGEPDEGQDLAGRLNVGSSPLQKRIDYSEDRDWFRIDLLRPLDTGEVLKVETLGALDLVMKLMDEEGNVLMDDDDSGMENNPMIMVSGLDTGSYYAVVHGFSGVVGDYEIMANVAVPVKDEFEDDNSMISASQISADGRPQRRNFSPMGDSDWVRFEVENDGRYTIKTAGDIDTYIELYDGNGEMIEENDDGSDYNAVIERYLSSGTYYLHVYPYGSTSTDEVYELMVLPSR